MNYGEILQDIRKDNNLTQQDIANLLNISRSTYKDYEIQIKIIPLKYLNIICNYFNLSLDYIFELSHEINYNNCKKIIDQKIFSTRFKEFRKENKLSQVKLADILKTSHSVVSDYENGKKIISTPFLYTICKKYKISADYILGKIDNPKYL